MSKDQIQGWQKQPGEIQPVKFLYWNLNHSPTQKLVITLAKEHDLDVIILSECALSMSDLLFELNKSRKRKYSLPYNPVKDTIILIRLPRESLKLVRDSPEIGVSVRRLVPPIGLDIVLIAVHFPGKLYQSEHDQALLATRLPRIIETTEEKVGHRRTLIVGDFNMNPFESGIIGAEGLHAVMTRQIAGQHSRIVSGEERLFFYNPMWSHFGEYPFDPPGTYFYNSAKQVNYFWNMFDQVMVRPDLLEHFDDETLHILTSAGATNLVNKNGIPDTSVASDHLPIIFSLDLMIRRST